MRTDSGEIFKVLEVEKGSIRIKSNYREWIGICCIVKHSKNIIDLIQVGDFVNGKLCIDIEEIITDDGRRNLNLVCLGGSILELSHEIYSILTKEQYEQNVFKVVE